LIPGRVSGIVLHLSLPAGKRVVGARQIDYPSGEERSLPIQGSGGVVSTTFDLGIHKLLVFELGPA
jgi:hypothetical protein